MQPFIFTMPDRPTQDEMLRIARMKGVKTRWIVIDPNPEYDGEFRFADESIFKHLAETVARIVNDEFYDGQPVWPKTLFEDWQVFQKRFLIILAVTRWNYLSHGGPEAQEVHRDYRERRIPHSMPFPVQPY